MNDPRIAQGLRVLLVEDEILILMDIEDTLRDLGAEVVGTAARLDAAMRLAEEKVIDIAFLDVHIQGGDTYAVADILQRRGIPFVFCTGYSDWSIDALYSGRPRVTKPYGPGEIEKQVRHLLNS